MIYSSRRQGAMIAALLALFFALSSLHSVAYAWKLKTHAYIANIVMEDAKDGKVWIPPYGEFEVRPEVVQAIKWSPEYFRGGSVGPDGFPDFWTGQSRIHSTTNPWLELLWDNLPTVNLNAIPTSSRQAIRQTELMQLQIWAFVFGYFSHCAGDMWAHDWVNYYAGGHFPGIDEMKADPTNKLAVITRHIAIENTLDKRVTLSANVIDVPNDFILNVMILNQRAIALGMNPIIQKFAVLYFEKLPHKDEIDYGTVGGSGTYVGSGITAPHLTYDAFWYADLEKGFKSTDAKNPGWMESNRRAIKDVMEKNQGMLSALVEYDGLWALTYFFDMLGWPSITRYTGEGLGANKAKIESALAAIGLDEDQRQEITDDAVNVFLELTLGMDKTAFDQAWSAEMTSQLFNSQQTAEIMADIGNPPSESTWNSAWTNQAEYANLLGSISGPLYNSVITAKLSIIKPTELKRLLNKQLPGKTGEVVILDVLKGIDYSMQFASGAGLGGDWLGYGMSLAQLKTSNWRPIFAFVFKPYGPRDMGRKDVWSKLDVNHRWGGMYPVSLADTDPPVLTNVVMSQFNSQTIEVEFKSDEEIQTACLEYKTPSNQTKTTAWVSGNSLEHTSALVYTLSLHEAGLPTGTYKIRIKAKDAAGNEKQTDFTDFLLFGSSESWGFTATPAANNTYVLKWNKYPRSGEFLKYVLDKGSQIHTTTQTGPVSYDADQIKKPATFSPIAITGINTTTKTVTAAQLTGLTITARSKRGNFLTEPIAPTVVQPPTTTTTTTATTTSTTTNATSTGNRTTSGSTTRPKYQ